MGHKKTALARCRQLVVSLGVWLSERRQIQGVVVRPQSRAHALINSCPTGGQASAWSGVQ